MAIRVDDVDLARDRELVARHQAGDPHAFADLYDRYFQRLVRFCRRQVGDPDVAEEIAQETFARALRALPRFAGERRFYPWLTVIARRLCVDHFRQRSRVDLDPDVDPGTHDEVNLTIESRADEACLDEALDNVRVRHRDVLRLRDWEDLSYEEIAARLDVPETTVPPLLHRARRALRREFLALMDPERLAAIPILGVLIRFAQRRRLGVVGRSGSHGPEIGSMGASIAAAALTAVTAVAPGLLTESPPETTPEIVEVEAGATTAPTDADASVPEAGATETTNGEEKAGTAPAPEPSDPEGVQVGPAQIDMGPDGADRTREEAERQPVSEEVGPVFFGVDPGAVTDDLGRLEERINLLGDTL